MLKNHGPHRVLCSLMQHYLVLRGEAAGVNLTVSGILFLLGC